MLPGLKLPRAAFCSLSSAAFRLPSVACLELPFILPSAGWTQHPSMYRSQPRGPAAIRTTASGPGSGSYPAPSSSSQVEGSSRSSGNMASALAQRPPGGYTALGPGQGRGDGRDMVAGAHVKNHSDAQSVMRVSYTFFFYISTIELRGTTLQSPNHCFEIPCASICICCHALLFCTACCMATRHCCDTYGTG